jgi:hypothetical protein
MNEDFDVVRFSLQRAREVFGLDTAADESRQPGAVGTSQKFSGPVPVPLIGIHAAHDHVVLQNRSRRNIGAGYRRDDAAVPNASILAPRQFIEEGRPAWTVDCRTDSNGRGQWHRMSHRRILGISVAKVPHGASYRVAMYVGFMTQHMEDSEFRMLSTVYRPKSHLIEAMIFDRDQFYSYRGVRKTTSRLIGRFSGQFFSICIRCTQTRSDNWCRVPSLSGSNSAVECQLPKRIPHPYLIGFSLF